MSKGFKLSYIAVVICLCFAVLAGGCGGSADKAADNTKQEQKIKQYSEVDINMMLQEAKDNAAAAKSNYNSKDLRIVGGVIGSIDSDVAFMVLDSSDANLSNLHIKCTIEAQNNALKDTVMKLKNGQSITACGTVTDVDSANGYTIVIDKVEPAAEKPVEVAVKETASDNQSIISTVYVANCRTSITLRRSPSTEAGEICQIPLGQPVGYIEDAGNGFSKVNFDGTVGYCLTTYLSDYKPNIVSPIARVVNCNEYITLRTAPSTSAAEITKIPLGDYVTVMTTGTGKFRPQNGFLRVIYGDREGYVLQDYLSM